MTKMGEEPRAVLLLSVVQLFSAGVYGKNSLQWDWDFVKSVAGQSWAHTKPMVDQLVEPAGVRQAVSLGIQHLQQILCAADVDVVGCDTLETITLEMVINRRFRRPSLTVNKQFTLFSYHGTIAWLACCTLARSNVASLQKVLRAQLVLKDYALNSETDNLKQIIQRLPNLVDLHLFLPGIGKAPDFAHVISSRLHVLRFDIPWAHQDEKYIIGVMTHLQGLTDLTSLHLGLCGNHIATDSIVEAMQPIMRSNNLRTLSVDFSQPLLPNYFGLPPILVSYDWLAKLLVLVAKSPLVSLSLSLQQQQMGSCFVRSLMCGFEGFKTTGSMEQIFIDVSRNRLCKQAIDDLVDCLFCSSPPCTGTADSVNAIVHAAKTPYCSNVQLHS